MESKRNYKKALETLKEVRECGSVLNEASSKTEGKASRLMELNTVCETSSIVCPILPKRRHRQSLNSFTQEHMTNLKETQNKCGKHHAFTMVQQFTIGP